ncbi:MULTISPECIES: hypothetical protein [Bacillus]|uniref:hypothetical protein n=1 Tax=Bacillus TaxID=1386 RepID=UPI000BA7E401|nr:hypothetical protein [Bacillus subtilis]PAE61147.1 hypothetical protein CHH88_04575 [Bacillus subtilis]
MNLIQVNNSEYEHQGYGAGSGDVIREEYKCPCGSGLVVYEKENIPGFRSTEIDCYCKQCNEKYDFGRGTATLKNNY